MLSIIMSYMSFTMTFVVNEPAVLENTATKKQHSLKSNNVTDLSGKCVIFFLSILF